MPLRVKLSEIVQSLDVQSNRLCSYLSRTTGDIVEITEEELLAAEAGEEWLTRCPQWQQENIRLVREILQSDDYILLPTSYEIHEYCILEKFCALLGDTDQARDIRAVLDDCGAFRKFKEKIRGYKLGDRWYAFRDEAFRRIAIDWCRHHGLEYEDDLG